MSGFWPRAPGRFALLLALIASLSLGAAACEDDGEQLKIGYLADFSGPLAEYGADIETGVQLAIKHINEAGGVNGQDVVYVTGDTRVDPTQSVEEARRLVDVEGVHAIVGPLSSTATLAVADSVTGPGGIPHISPSATSPALTDADDNGYLFRTTGSDAIQGVVLAQLVESEGHTNVGVIFRDDAWGQGLSGVFSANYSGTATLASYAADGQPSYLAELQQAASGGAEVLVAMGFAETEVFLRESIENEHLHALHLHRRQQERGPDRAARRGGPRGRRRHGAEQQPGQRLDEGVGRGLHGRVRSAALAPLRARGV